MNLFKQLVLSCKECGWIPPQDTVMEAVQLHCQVEHNTNEPVLNLSPLCKCGVLMDQVAERPTGGGKKVYFECPNCEATGFVISGQVPKHLNQ